MRGSHRTMLLIAIVGACLFFACSSAMAQSPKAAPPIGCPLNVAIQKIDEFEVNRMAEYANNSQLLLNAMNKLIDDKANKPGASIGQQLSPQDLTKFNQLRRALALNGAEAMMVSNFQRDVHVIAETYNVAELADLYEVTKDSLGDADPRRFYFTILESLRIAQPRTSRTPQVSLGIDCDPEAGLYFYEEFNQQELAKLGANQRLVNLVFDIERLRTFYQLCWNLFNKGIDDTRKTTWVGDPPKTVSTIAPYIANSGTAIQMMYKEVIPYIDAQFPSKYAFELAFNQKTKRDAEHDYPARR
jgi:hypothetical protein